MKIYIVRHGQTICNKNNVYYGALDVSLTDLGRTQARQVGELLKDVAFDRVILSGLKRTQETADEVLSVHQAGVLPAYEKYPALNEMNFGAWEGLHYTQVREQWPEDFKAFGEDWVHARPTDGEIYTDFRERVLTGFKTLALKEDETILYVGHGGPISCILADALGMPIDAIWHLNIGQGVYCRLDINKGYPILMGLNMNGPAIIK